MVELGLGLRIKKLIKNSRDFCHNSGKVTNKRPASLTSKKIKKKFEKNQNKKSKKTKKITKKKPKNKKKQTKKKKNTYKYEKILKKNA